MSSSAVRRRKKTTNFTPALPSESDISTFHLNDWSTTKKLARLIGYVLLRIPVWWTRGGFHSPEYRDNVPKWHILRARIHSGEPKDWDVIWVAQCGYEYVNDDLLGWFRDFRKTAPKKADRCAKCEDALATIKRVSAEKE